MELQAAGVLMGLAVAVFAGEAGGGRAALGTLVVAAAVSSAALAWLAAPDVGALAFCALAASATAFARPRWDWLPPLAGGGFAAAWISVLHAQGLPWPPAALLAASVAAAAWFFGARRADFAPPGMRDEALVVVGSFALLLAVTPGVVDGWRSAVALQAEPLSSGFDFAPWLGALVVGVALLGGAYTAWKRR